MKNIIVYLTLISLGIITLVGCGGNQELVSVNKDELVFANFRDLRDLNPHLYGGEMFAQGMLFETLVTLTEDGFEPNLATSWNISEDGKTYTFFIREGVNFSDGEVLDAHAIEANFDAILENKDRHTWLESVLLMESAKAIDDYTFEIILSKPYYPLLTELAATRPYAMISPAVMINGSTKDGVLDWVGTGPYVLVEHNIDEYAIFEVNPNYWGDAPNINKIKVRVIPDNQTRIMALRNGEIDLIYGKNMIDAQTVHQFSNSDEFTIDLSTPTSTRHIIFNTTNEILSDIKVRQALQHATNREAISEGIFFGIETPADSLFSRTIPYSDVDLVPYVFDMEIAASLLDEAGWIDNGNGIREKNGKPLELTLLYNINSVSEQAISELLQSEYRKLGIDLTILGEEEQSYRDNMKMGNFDMSFNISWGLPYDPQSSLSSMRRPVYGDFAAQQGVHNLSELHQGITDILMETDPYIRQNYYDFVLTRLHEEAIYLPLTYENNKAIYRSELEGVSFAPDQFRVPFTNMYWK